MKKEDIKKKLKPRATDVNEILRTKKGGRHEPKEGDNIKRSRQKERDRRELVDID